ncbi:TlrC/CarA/OleB/SrmB family ABC-F type ribosomal protection protein [Nonomuraea sp. NPDC050310]|uniref:TlrC/CarA/OleB/SrmB family ABC-F type ribosomal protection protein n=1 Tax=Nonomuraea sp. NPDC050310 TaxID=3154935 RepID=UPI0033DE3F52
MRTAQLTLDSVTKRFDDRVVLDQVSLTVKPGEKVGIIGDNGSGKSTLLKLVAGVVAPDNGELTVSAPGGIGYLAQTLDLPAEASVQDAVDLALADLRELEAQLRAAETDLTDLDTYGELLARYEARGGYEADLRLDIALDGLGLPGLDRSRALGTLSGGERARLALAAVLASSPELLLLDEPTNDLDDQAVTWLENHLRGHRGTVVAITHDRVFLERITATILEVEGGQVRRFGNGYEGYLAAKAAERQAMIRAYQDWLLEIDRHSSLVTANAGRLAAIPRKVTQAGMGTGAWRARSRSHGAMSRIRQSHQRLTALQDNPVAPPPERLRFTAAIGHPHENPGGHQPARAVAELVDVRVGSRLRLPYLTVGQGERLLVTGPNGAGKSTLMRVLAGELTPGGGTVAVRGKVGYLRQEETPWNPALPVLRAFAQGRPGDPAEHAELLLSLGLFHPGDLRLRVGELSYGQRRRIELARLVTEPVDLLLLDEPTNHLSPALVEELEEALESYTGALVVVTHDRRMRAGFSGRHLELDAGHVAHLQAA